MDLNKRSLNEANNNLNNNDKSMPCDQRAHVWLDGNLGTSQLPKIRAAGSLPQSN